MISSAFGSQVTYSQITRALWALACGARDAIRARTRRIPNIPVPSRRDHAATAEYKQALADFLEVVIKRLLVQRRQRLRELADSNDLDHLLHDMSITLRERGRPPHAGFRASLSSSVASP